MADKEMIKLDLANTKQVLKRLKNLNLKETSCDEIKELLIQVIATPLPVITAQRGSAVIRSRIFDLNTTKEMIQNKCHIPTTEAQLSLPKRKKFFSLGRANTENTSAFYGSISTEFMTGYQTSMLELAPKLVADFSLHELVSGLWIIQKPMKLIVLGSINDAYVNLNSFGKVRNELLDDFLKNNADHQKAIRLVDDFLGNEFAKEVKKGEEYNYKISACYAELLDKSGNFKGIIYPSVATAGAGANMLIFNQHVRDRNITLIKAAYAKIYFRNNTFQNELVMIADNDNSILRWKENFNGAIPNFMKRYFLGNSADNWFQKYIEMIQPDKPITAKKIA